MKNCLNNVSSSLKTSKLFSYSNERWNHLIYKFCKIRLKLLLCLKYKIFAFLRDYWKIASESLWWRMAEVKNLKEVA